MKVPDVRRNLVPDTWIEDGESSGFVAGGRRHFLFPLNFGLSENCRKLFFTSDNYRPKIQNFGPKKNSCWENL